jgi:hypothetical protein
VVRRDKTKFNKGQPNTAREEESLMLLL